MIPGIGQPIDYAAMAKGQGLWSPDTLAQGLQLARGQGATLGNPQAVQQAQQANLAQMMEAYKAAQGQQQLGQEMMRPEYVQNSGGLGALAMIAQTYAGQRMRKKADESASDYAGRIFAEEQRMERERVAEEEAKATRLRNEELAREDGLRSWQASREDARFAEDRRRYEEGMALDREALAFQRANQGRSRGPSLAEQIAEKEAVLGRPLSEQERGALIGIPGAEPQRADPVAVRDAADRARAAAEALATLGELNQLHKDGGILGGGISTGPLDQWAPGADGQKYDQLSNTLNLSTLRANFGGNPAEGERDANLKTLPARNRYESVNKDRIEQLRAQMVGRIEYHNRMPGVEPIAIPDWAIQQNPARPAQPARANMGGGGMTNNLANPAPAGGGYQAPQVHLISKTPVSR